MNDWPIRIAPSILAGDFSCLGDECRIAEDAGADWIHVDVMDGHFVPAITFGASTCSALRPHIKGVMDVHLMISPVDPHLDDFIASGADVLTVHVESGPHVHRTLQKIRNAGIRPGVALNPATPASALYHLIDLVDLVCVMTVNPGFGGQSFISSQIEKIGGIRKLTGRSRVHVQVDGGINASTARLAVEAGADVLVAGSAVFGNRMSNKSEDYARNIAEIRSTAKSIGR